MCTYELLIQPYHRIDYISYQCWHVITFMTTASRRSNLVLQKEDIWKKDICLVIFKSPFKGVLIYKTYIWHSFGKKTAGQLNLGSFVFSMSHFDKIPTKEKGIRRRCLLCILNKDKIFGFRGEYRNKFQCFHCRGMPQQFKKKKKKHFLWTAPISFIVVGADFLDSDSTRLYWSHIFEIYSQN